MKQRWSCTKAVPASHPALPGHFPGRPLVPGVLLLEVLATTLETRVGGHIACIKEVKFLHPLQPDETAEWHVEVDGRQVGFEVTRAAEQIARGRVELAA